MSSLMQSKNNRIIEHFTLNPSLFDSFDHVYIFGSILCFDVCPNDIDLLLVYSVSSPKICEEIDLIKARIEEELHFPVDLTILSQNELIETDFLSRIGKYKLIK